MVPDEAISEFFGYASVACWLGAQFPQIVVNWRRKSVDGLALPFLLNWFFGDATNLIGCLLTNQLPFQTYLATYFVFVDSCLILQYFRYDAVKDARALSTLRSHSRTPLIIPPSLSYSPITHTLPHTNISGSRSRSYSMGPHLRSAASNAPHESTDHEAGSHASELDIQPSHARWRGFGTRRAGSLEGLPESVVVDPHIQEWAQRRARGASDAGEDEVDLESEPMIASFYSEGGGRERSRDQHVSWDTRGGRRLSNDLPQPESSAASLAVRGRQLSRPAAVYDSPTATETSPAPFARARTTSTASTISAGASRRSAGIVFLGVFALLGLGARDAYRIRDVAVKGVVLSATPANITLDVPLASSGTLSGIEPPFVEFATAENFKAHITSNAETKLLIGRISAWTCTTLYITSRLPQIWKNFVRKSVEGLSMYLFTFAFLGNLFYVVSILTNSKMDLPAPQAAQFLRASIPYLLGSGGTLIFDVTIVLQSFVYKRPHRRRRKSLVSASAEEENALLGTDAAN